MKTKLIAMVLGVALVLATATIYTQSAFAGAGSGGRGANGVTDGQTAHGLATACGNPGAEANNPHCGNGGSAGGVLRVKPVEGW